MKPREAMLHFLDNSARGPYQKSLAALEEYYLHNVEQLTKGFYQSFIQLCQKISDMQGQGGKGKIAYLHYSLLYTSLMQEQNRYRVEAFDQNWYLDQQECVVDYDASWAYCFLHEVSQWMNVERKKYVGRITSYDIDLLKRMEAFKYGMFVEALAKRAIKQAVASPEFAAIDKEEVVRISIGEYKDHSQPIYCYDIRNKEIEVIKEQLLQPYPQQYVSEVWEKLNFSQMKFDQLDLRYVRFTGSTMKEVQFQSTLLWETDFTHTHIEASDFSYSELLGADFSHVQMKDCQCRHSDGAQCDLTREKWVGSIPAVNFYHGKLSHVDFTGSQLQQAIFQGAQLTQCNFQYCNLQGADFTGASLTECDFTDAKLAGAKFPL